MKEMICKRCGKKYLTDNSRNHFCSERCKKQEIRKCLICGKEYWSIKVSTSRTCSKECMKELKKQTTFKNYGVENPSQSKEVLEKKKKTSLEKYGTEYPQQSNLIKEKTAQTCLERYGYKSSMQCKDIKVKAEQTNLERYGYKVSTQNKDIRNKAKITNLKRYGKEEIFGGDFLKDLKKATIIKYGVEYNSQRDDVKKKARETNLKKYGRVNGNGFGSNNINIEEIQKKIIETKRKNNTFHTSSVEDKAKEKLLEICGEDLECQYKSDLYPYLCDFYIKSLDLYIELNYHWSHGFKPFDSNDKNDLALIEKWKSKNTKYYNEAIKTWTVRDVEKLKTFKKNNLNYKIFYNEKEFNDYIDSLYIIQGYDMADILNICLKEDFPGSNKYEANHPIWDCRVGINNLSPKEAWSCRSYLKGAIKNLFKVYNHCVKENKYPNFIQKIDKAFKSDKGIARVVLERFTIAKIAPKVTALSKNEMLRILRESGIDLSKYKGVYIPMAGFGGIVEAVKEYALENKIELDIEAYDINKTFCSYYGWVERDVLKTNIETDKIVIACPPFGKEYENWNQKSELEPDTMYSFKDWCNKIMGHIKAPNYIFIGPTDKNEEKVGKQNGLFAKKVGIKWYPEYTK